MITDYLDSGRGPTRWDGYVFAKVYRDEHGNLFSGGTARYQVFYNNRCIGYADSQTAADKLFLNYRFGDAAR